MALTLKIYGKGVARFEVADDDAETVVAVNATDDQETMVRKLRRVIALAEGTDQALRQWVANQAPAPSSYGAQLAMADIVRRQAPATLEPPVLPDRLKGDVELMGTSGVAEVPYDQTPSAERTASGHEGAPPQPGNGWAAMGEEG